MEDPHFYDVFLTNAFKDVYLYEYIFSRNHLWSSFFQFFFNAFLKDTTSTMGGLQLSFAYGRRFSAVDLPSPGAVGLSSFADGCLISPKMEMIIPVWYNENGLEKILMDWKKKTCTMKIMNASQNRGITMRICLGIHHCNLFGLFEDRVSLNPFVS